MEIELGISPGNESQKDNVANRNVVTSYDLYRNDPKSVLRSYSVQPGEYRDYGTVGFESSNNPCKPTSPIAPSTSPSLQVLPSITPVHETPEPETKVSWKDFLTQLNAERKKSRFLTRSELDDTRVLQHKYSRPQKQKTLLKVLQPTHAPAPKPTKYTSPSPRPHHLKPLDSRKRPKKKKKRTQSLDIDLDVSGNSLACPVSEPPPHKDYTPGFVKVKHHDCYRCVNRMTVHDQHSWNQAFNSACRIRKPSTKQRSKAAGEHLLCVHGSKDKSITNEEDGKETQDQIALRPQDESIPNTNLDEKSAPDGTTMVNHKPQNPSKSIAKKRLCLLRAGKIADRQRNHQRDPKFLSSSMLTTPINIEFLKNLKLNNLTYSLKEEQSLMAMAIEYNIKDRKKIMERKLQKQQKNADLAIASSFTMLTQLESVSDIHKEQDELRELSYSIMEDTNVLYRPDSIISMSEVQFSNRIPVFVFSETDIRETNKDVQLNKNTSANNNIDACTNSKDGTGEPKSKSEANSLEDPDASSKEQLELTSIISCDNDSSCYWVSTSEMVHPSNELLENGAPQLSQNLQIQSKKRASDVTHVSGNLPNTSGDYREDEDPYLEEDDDEEGDAFYEFQSCPQKFNLENFVLPTGRTLCFTAMTDKRYNKWSRQKRKGTSSKWKPKKREDKNATWDESLSANQEACLRNLEAIYRSREGTLKYNHDKARAVSVTNNVTPFSERGPTSDRDGAAYSKVSVTNIKSCVQTVSLTQCVSQVRSSDGITEIQSPLHRNSTCGASNSFADGVKDEHKMLYTSSNNDQSMPQNRRRGLHHQDFRVRTNSLRCPNVENVDNQGLRPSTNKSCSLRRSATSNRSNIRGSKPADHVPRKTSSLFTMSSNYKDSVQKEECLQTKDEGVELPELVRPVDAQAADQKTRSVPSHTYIASVQRQILNYHRKDFINGNSLICPLYVNLPTMDLSVLEKGHTGVMRSALTKPIRRFEQLQTSPRFIPRTFTAVRNSEDPVLCVGKDKKPHVNTTHNIRRPKLTTNKKRAVQGEPIEAVTIHDLLYNLNSNDSNDFKAKKRPANKSPCRGQTFKEIYSKKTNPTGNRKKTPLKGEKERSLSALSISNSSTFSVLPFPDFYKNFKTS